MRWDETIQDTTCRVVSCHIRGASNTRCGTNGFADCVAHPTAAWLAGQEVTARGLEITCIHVFIHWKTHAKCRNAFHHHHCCCCCWCKVAIIFMKTLPCVGSSWRNPYHARFRSKRSFSRRKSPNQIFRDIWKKQQSVRTRTNCETNINQTVCDREISHLASIPTFISFGCEELRLLRLLTQHGSMRFNPGFHPIRMMCNRATTIFMLFISNALVGWIHLFVSRTDSPPGLFARCEGQHYRIVAQVPTVQFGCSLFVGKTSDQPRRQTNVFPLFICTTCSSTSSQNSSTIRLLR